MKKSTIIMAIVLAVFAVGTILNEMDMVTYQRSTCAMVKSAKKNGAITADEAHALYAMADKWHPHLMVRRDNCERVRRMIHKAYEEQREREEREPKVYQTISHAMTSYRTIREK
ncbi:MAG: hypothetical protein J6Y33_03075 [Prevotella sp.]|nr:hypothetical protein [Prevotella sp.]